MAEKKSVRSGRVVMAVSPHAGSGRGRSLVPELRARLGGAGYEVLLSESLPTIKAAVLRKDDDPPLRAVAVLGGDGSLSLVANTLPAGTPILPVPLGTENLLARYFGCTAEPAAVVAAVQQGRQRTIDAGTANGKLFLVMATCGFDAEVVRAMHLTRRGHIRRWSYFKPIARAVRSYAYPEVRVVPGGGPTAAAAEGIEGEATGAGAAAGRSDRPLTCRWAMVFNLPMYGGGLRIAPQAIPDDGQLDFVGLRGGGSLSTIQYLSRVYSGRLQRRADGCARRGTSWRWEANVRVPFQLDGDYVGRLPVAIGTLPGRVTLILPPPVS